MSIWNSLFGKPRIPSEQIVSTINITEFFYQNESIFNRFNIRLEMLQEKNSLPVMNVVYNSFKLFSPVPQKYAFTIPIICCLFKTKGIHVNGIFNQQNGVISVENSLRKLLFEEDKGCSRTYTFNFDQTTCKFRFFSKYDILPKLKDYRFKDFNIPLCLSLRRYDRSDQDIEELLKDNIFNS